MEPQLTITGNLGSTPILSTRGEASHTEFSVAHTPRILRDGQWTDGTTTWIRVSCWRALARNAVLSLHQGDRVLVTGRLRSSEWTDTTTGEVRTRMVLEADALGPDLSRAVASPTRENGNRSNNTNGQTGPNSAGLVEGGSAGQAGGSSAGQAGVGTAGGKAAGSSGAGQTRDTDPAGEEANPFHEEVSAL